MVITQEQIIEQRRYDYEWWLDQYKNCFPATYPRILYTQRDRKIVHRNELKLFGVVISKAITSTHFEGVCARCNERISPGHVCQDISEYFNNLSNEQV